MTPEFCPGCGRAVAECPGACLGPSDTARFCPTCGRRMAVLVTPTRTRARCKDHGVYDSDTGRAAQ